MDCKKCLEALNQIAIIYFHVFLILIMINKLHASRNHELIGITSTLRFAGYWLIFIHAAATSVTRRGTWFLAEFVYTLLTTLKLMVAGDFLWNMDVVHSN